MTRPPFFVFPSVYLALCLIFSHTVVLVSLFFILLPNFVLSLLYLVLSFSLFYYILRDAMLKLSRSWVAFRLEQDRIVLIRRDGHEWAGKLLDSSFTTPYLVLLNFSGGRWFEKTSLILMADSVNAQSFRQLRIILNWRGSAAH
jgi:toxin CptA